MTDTKAPVASAKVRKAALAAVVAPGQSPFAALAAAADKLLEEADDADAGGIDWTQPQEIGRGLLCQLQGSMLLMAVNVSDLAKRKAKPSNSGDMLLLGTSAGFRALKGLGIKIGVNVGMDNPNKPKKGIGSK